MKQVNHEENYNLPTIEKALRSTIYELSRYAEALKKHYEPEPELKKGMWVEHNKRYYVFTKDHKNTRVPIISLRGETENVGIKQIKPHTFVESDLELLNTDKVKYELKTVGKECYVYSMNLTEKGGENIGSMYYSIHEAIKEAFDTVLAKALLKKQIGE